MIVQVTPEQIDEQIDKAQEGMAKGSNWPGMSYEQGVENTLRWVLGDSDTAPMDEE